MVIGRGLIRSPGEYGSFSGRCVSPFSPWEMKPCFDLSMAFAKPVFPRFRKTGRTGVWRTHRTNFFHLGGGFSLEGFVEVGFGG